MIKISLHDYHQRILKMLDDNHIREAAAHCRHILQQYPRHVDTYRALAQSLLEQGEYAAAIDLFHRVLSAEPNDFVSHLGLAIVFEDQATLPQSVWHMERAFEIKPYDAIVEQKLRELYQLSGSKAPKRLPLSQGALARIYLRGELYQNAITELGQALLQDKDRIDLEVLLAEALWRDDQRVDTVEVCRSVLDRLPNCISANAILAEIWLLTGRTSEASELLQRLQALTQADVAHCDLESPVGRAFRANGAQYLPERVEIDFLDEISADLADLELIEDTDADIGEAEEGLESEGMFGWLRDDAFGEEEFTPAEADRPELAELQPLESLWLVDQQESAIEENGVLADLPDWLNDADTTMISPAESVEEHVAAPYEVTGEEPDVTDVSDEGQEVPDWLAGTSDTEFRPLEADPSMLESSWFSGQSEDELGRLEDQIISEDDADWLSLLDEVDAEAAGSLEIPELAFGDLPGGLEAELLPDWLSQVGGTGEAEALQPADADAARPALPGEATGDELDQAEETVPDWLLSDELGLPAEIEDDLRPATVAPGKIETPTLDFDEEPEQEELQEWMRTSEPDHQVDLEGGGVEFDQLGIGSELRSLEGLGIPEWLIEDEPDQVTEPGPMSEPAEMVEAAADLSFEEEPGESDWDVDLEEEEAFPDEALAAPSPEFDTGLLEQVDDELPEWLKADQFDTLAGIEVVERTMDSLGLSTDMLSLDKANLPDWLRADEPGAGETLEAEGQTDLRYYQDEGLLPDSEEDDEWAAVEGPLAEIEPDTLLAGATDLDEQGFEGEEEELPDWLRDDQLDTLVGMRAVEQTMDSLGLDTGLLSREEASIPDWLQEDEPETMAVTAADAGREGTADFEPEMFDLGVEDLPDWLQGDQLDTMVGKRVVDQTAESLGLSTAPRSHEEELIPDLSASEVSDTPSLIGESRAGDALLADEISSAGLPFEDGVTPDSAELDEWYEGLESLETEELFDTEEAPDFALSGRQDMIPDWLDADRFEPGDEAAMLEQLAQMPHMSLEEFDADAPALDWLTDVDADGQFQLEDAVIGPSDETEFSDAESEEAPTVFDVIQDDVVEQPGLEQAAEAGSAEEMPHAFADEAIPESGSSELEGQVSIPLDAPADLQYASESDWWDEEPELAEMASIDSEPSLGWDDELAWIEDIAARDADLSEDDLRFADKSEPELEVRSTTTRDERIGDSGEIDEAMAWLEEVAEEETPIVESPEMAITERPPLASEIEYADEIGDLDEAMTWLEEVAAEDEALAAQAPQLADAPIWEMVSALPEPVDEIERLPDDADETMDWLEDSAGDGEAPIDELRELAGLFDLTSDGGPDLDLFELDSPDISAAELESLFTEAHEETEVQPEEPAEAMFWDRDLSAGEAPDLQPADLFGVAESIADDVAGLSATIEAELIEADEPTPGATLPQLFADLGEVSGELDDSAAWFEAPKPGEEWAELDTMPEQDMEMELAPPGQPVTAAAEGLDESLEWPEAAFDDEMPDEERFELEALLEFEMEMGPEDVDEAVPPIEVEATVGADEPDEPGALPPGEILAVEPTMEETDQDLAVQAPGAPEELDDAMAWLEQLAARQGAPAEELPTVTLAAESVDEALMASEPPGYSIEDAALMSAGESGDEMTPEEQLADAEVPEDLDAAMAWLEDLAARQGAPVEELPSIDGITEPEAGVETLPAVAEPMDMAADMSLELEAGVPAEAPAEELGDIEEDLDEAMAWLQGLATQQDTLLAEPPAPAGAGESVTEGLGADEPRFFAEPQPAKTSVLPAELEDALDWLQQLSEQEVTPTKVVPDLLPGTLDISDQELSETLDWLEQLALTGRPSAEPEMAAAEQEHPDALYELDTLIAEEESLAEIQELPTGFDEVPEADLRPADGVEADMEWAAAEEPEARISRFEDVAEALESSVIDDEPSVEDQVAPEFQPAELHVRPTFGSDDDALFELSVGVSEGVLEDGFLDDIPEDPDAALAWLEQFIEESDTTVAESSRMESTAGSGIEETGLEVTPDLAETVRESPEETRLTGRLFEEMGDDLDQDLLDNIPEDPDEVVAWLQQFSREGEVAVAEPPTGAEEDELTRSGGPPLEATAETAELDESMPDLLIGEAPGLPGEDGLVDDIGVRFEEDLADSLPEWLMFEQGDEGGTKQTDWLRSLPAPDVAGWLEAEEEATVSGVYNFDTLTGSAATGYDEEPMVEIDLLEEIASEEATGEDEEEAMSAAADLDRSQLTMARRSLAGGDHDEAIAAYQSLIEKGEGLSTLIDDLESAASTFDSQPLLRRLLGDAYMQNGQLQKALDNYRQALDQL